LWRTMIRTQMIRMQNRRRIYKFSRPSQTSFVVIVQTFMQVLKDRSIHEEGLYDSS
jgi:hypothetical protein